MASWWDTLNPFSGAELSDAEQARAMGAYQGLLNMGAQMMDAGRPRLVMQEGFGPGLLGGIGRGAAAFGQGMAEGRRNYMQQGLLDERARGMRDWRQAVQSLPEADRPLYQVMGPERGAQALLEDRRTQRQMEEARAFIGGGQRPPAAMEPPAAAESMNAGQGNLPRGLRNNNPLNIEAGPFAQNQSGFAGSDGRFARFNDPEAGLAAADNLLQSYAARGLNTPQAIIARWAPAGDGNNNPSSYAATVAQKIGVRPDQTLDMTNPQVRRSLLMAMAEVENGRPMTTNVNATNMAGGSSGGTAPSPQQIAMAAASGNPVLQRWATTMAPFVRAQARAEEQPETFYGTVQWGQDANGRPVMLVPSNRGNLRPLEPPPGVQVSPPGQTVNTGDAFTTINPRTGQPIAQTPINIRRREAEEQTGQAQGRATANAPQAIAQTEYALQLVDALRNHRALTASTGLTGPALSIIPGTPMYDFRQRAAQLQGQNFLAAFEALRGGGQISNAEGEKATQAIARLNQGLSERDFKQALDELTTILNQGLDRARQAEARGTLNQPRPPDAVGSGPPSPPRVGETRDGYRFRGGNPADPQAWERVQ